MVISNQTFEIVTTPPSLYDYGGLRVQSLDLIINYILNFLCNIILKSKNFRFRRACKIYLNFEKLYYYIKYNIFILYVVNIA